MAEDDVAALELLEDAVQDGLSAAVLLPVHRVPGPLDHLVTRLVGGLDDRVAVLAEGGPKEGAAVARQLLQHVIQVLELLLDGDGVHLGHVGMGQAVVADLVAPLRYLLDEVRVLLDPHAAEEEGGLHVVFVQRIQDKGSLVGVPGGVDGEGDLVVLPTHAVDGQGPALHGQDAELVGLHLGHSFRHLSLLRPVPEPQIQEQAPGQQQPAQERQEQVFLCQHDDGHVAPPRSHGRRYEQTQ